MKKYLCLFAAFTVAVSCQKTEFRTAEKTDTDGIRMGTVVTHTMLSTEMNRMMNTTVWLPPGYDANKEYPFLYLLHGATDDNNSWNQKGDASSFADRYVSKGGVPMVIIMPDALLTFYRGDFEAFFYNSLMPAVEGKYHCNGKRAVAGLSMGGFGTVYYCLKYPDKFTYGYAMSPASDLSLFSSLASARPSGDFPRMTVESGTDDGTVKIAGVRDMVSMLTAYGLPVNFIERSGGHEWGFWKACLEKALDKVGGSFK